MYFNITIYKFNINKFAKFDYLRKERGRLLKTVKKIEIFGLSHGHSSKKKKKKKKEKVEIKRII